MLQQEFDVEEARDSVPIVVDVDPEISEQPIIILQDDTLMSQQQPEYAVADQQLDVPILVDEDTNTVIIPENEFEAEILLSSQQPQNDDPLVSELTDEIEKEQELREHIDELALLLKTRYAL
jgi:hypothetical protein